MATVARTVFDRGYGRDGTSTLVRERRPAASAQGASRGPLDRHVSALTLAGLPGLGDRGFRVAVDHFGSARAALRAPKALRALVPRSSTGASHRALAKQAARDTLERTAQSGLAIWTYGDDEYPSRLTHLHDPPAVLWGRGKPAWFMAARSCAVVGSRRATPYGLRTAGSLGRHLAASGITVVSGMAFGVDGAAHRGALEAGGGTIAVLGSGVDVPTPKSQRHVYDRIVDTGLVVSEFPPGSPATAHNFPRRNRILAALSHAVVVVEAAARSGALITVDHALDLGVPVFAVPGPIDTARSSGSNALLADGAGVVISPEALVEALGGAAPRVAGPIPSSAGKDPVIAEVWSVLADGPHDVDRIVSKLGRRADEVLAALGALELDGRIELAPGAIYVQRDGTLG